MTINELLTYIKIKLKGCSSYAFIDSALKDLKIEMENRKDFKPVLFKRWFREKNVFYKNNPIAFLLKCGIEDIKNGEFDDKTERIVGYDMRPVRKLFEEQGITYTDYDIALMNSYFVYLSKHEYMSDLAIGDWTKIAIKHIAESTKDASEMKEIFKKSQTMKEFHIPHQLIYDYTERDLKEYQDMFDENGNFKM